MNEPLFEEGYVDSVDNWDHFKYHFRYTNDVDIFSTQLFDWCLENIETTLGWHVLFNGVVIFKEEDAMAFKLRWM